MRKILMSIKPRWCCLIINDLKFYEVRKTAPRVWVDYLNGKTTDYPDPIEVLIYATKDGHLVRYKSPVYPYDLQYLDVKRPNRDQLDYLEAEFVEGKIVAKFTLYKVDEYINGHNVEYMRHNASTCQDFQAILKRACLTEDELFDYCEDLHFYVWEIGDLEVFDKPRPLSDFNIKIRDNVYRKRKAPQSWCYVEN